ncbi:10191_t:CDS:1, partial [Racocetra persica]
MVASKVRPVKPQPTSQRISEWKKKIDQKFLYRNLELKRRMHDKEYASKNELDNLIDEYLEVLKNFIPKSRENLGTE